MQGRIVPPQTPDANAITAPSGQEEQERRIEFLGRVGLFYGIDPELLRQVAVILRPVPVAAGTIICSEGDPADQFYLIGEGTLTVLIDSGDNQRVLATLGPGEFFGESALLSGGARTATVRADSQALLWIMTAHDFQALLAYSPEIAAVVRRADQIRTTERKAAVFEVERRNLAALAHGKQRITIGRGNENDLVFPSRLVSRAHAVVESVGDHYEIRDLGSSNGTYVNGQQVRTAALKDGDEIWVADERFYFDRREIRRLVEPRGIRVDVNDLTKVVKGGKKLLNEISLSILPGEFVAIVGGSGAGKTTLMDAMSGVRPASSGSVRYNGRDYYRNLALFRNSLGYVPQDDIIHTDLPVRSTLRYAAKLRLPPDTSKADIDAAVDGALAELSLTGQADIPVGSLSGGQRKRASIGVELLTRPRIFYLDEPTSGLDPATDAQMMRLMRGLANNGSTVVLTTHATKNVMICDKIIFLARGGFLAFVGTPQRALQYFGAEAFDEIYELLAGDVAPAEWAARFRASPEYARMLADQVQPEGAAGTVEQQQTLAATGRSGGILHQLRQLGILTQRGLAILLKNPHNLPPLIIPPVVITLLLMALFKAGAFKLDNPNPIAPLQILFFTAFVNFFFGVAFGIQEICKETAIFRRERMVNLAILPYVLAKLIVRIPILVFISAFMLTVLRISGRMPAVGWDVYGPLWLSLILTAFAGFSMALMVSAIVPAPEQATQVMPLVIMPQVLFAGGILPVPSMNVVGRFISIFAVARWSLESLGHVADLNNLFANTTSATGRGIGLGLLAQYGDTFSRNTVQNWAILIAFALVFLVITCLLLVRKSRQG